MEEQSSVEASRILVSVKLVNGDGVEGTVDKDIAEFDSYFQDELKNERLTKPEKAVIKTYLAWQLLHRKR